MKAEIKTIMAGELGMTVEVVTKEHALSFAKSYARIQIENDREQVKKLHIKKGLKKDAPILKAIDNLPITLD